MYRLPRITENQQFRNFKHTINGKIGGKTVVCLTFLLLYWRVPRNNKHEQQFHFVKIVHQNNKQILLTIGFAYW